ncbi:MAG: hypothetical protein Roseis2KO_50400 [Roseivirga sp.]
MLLFVFMALSSQAQNAFITTWETTEVREAIEVGALFSNNYTIDWGDGTIETGRSNNATHVYENPGIHRVTITGDFQRFSANRGTVEKLRSVEQWGTIAWSSFESAFNGAVNFQLNATDAPDLSGVTSMRMMFAGATMFNADLSGWDVSTVTDMSFMFWGATSFNGDITNWNVSSVTTMSWMFRDAYSFNRDIGSWDVSSVTDIERMFMGTNSMAFNQDISGWEVGQIQRFNFLFYVEEGTGAFNQNLGSWDISGMTQASVMFTNTSISVDNYDAMLIGWAEQDVRTPTVGVGGLKYCSLGEAARNILLEKGMRFFEDERSDNCPPQLASATKDSDTQITVTFTENVQTNGGNPVDFTVVDGNATNYPVSAQTDGTPGDMEIVLTVADLSGAIGDLEVSYTNNNNEIFDTATGNARSSVNPVIINITPPVMVSGVRDSYTQLTITFDEDIITQEGNPTDFTVRDEQNNPYAVSAQEAGSDEAELELTVADFSQAIGKLTVTYTNNNNEISNLVSVPMETDAVGVEILDEEAPVLIGATKDSDTQITVLFSEPVQTNGGNPGDFTVVDGVGTNYTVSAQADGTAMDNGIVLTVANLSTAAGGLTITYANDNDEITDFGGNSLLTDATGVHLSIISDPNAFVTTWEANRDGARITVLTNTDNGEVYNYTIDWGDGSAPEANQQGDAQHTYASKGIYTVSITGDFPRLGGGSSLMLSVEQWGNIAWTTFESAFVNSRNLQINTTGAPDLSGVTSLAGMFQSCIALNSDINHWDVSGITDMSGMFRGASSFNQDLNGWNVSSVENMASMFERASAFNGDISDWTVSKVTDMSSMFASAVSFNGDISQWDVSGLTTMFSMFSFATEFNADISQWQVGNVTSLRGTFAFATSFDQNISGWDVSKVTNMNSTFNKATAFNQDISGWNVSAVTDMSGMFNEATVFNQDIGSWQTGNVTTLASTFTKAELFNQDISNWDISNVTSLSATFSGAKAFDQNLGNWDVTGVTLMLSMLSNAGLSVANYDATLVGWAEQDLTRAVALGVTDLMYCTAGDLARDILIEKGWVFFGDESSETCFPIVVDATKDSDTQITVEFSENVMSAGGNPTDFTVTDDANNNYAVSAQIDDVAGDAKVVLTVADLSAAVGDLTVTYTNNNEEIVGVLNGPVDSTIRGIVIDITPPVMVSGVRDSNSQLTITFSDPVQTNEGNPGDFMVVDEASNIYPVLSQTDDVANDIRIVLTLSDLTMAIGNLTVTYTNNNDEVSNFLGSIMATDATGIQILDESLPVMTSAVKDSDTQLTVSFNEPVQVNGTNASDFIVTDGAGNAFAVTGIADGTARDTEILLTVANLSSAVGGVTVTYVNSNDEVTDYGNNPLATDEVGLFISILGNATDFVMTWTVTSDGEEITIPTTDDNGEVYDYTIDWGDGNTDTNQTGDADHSYAKAGTYQVSISGDFPRIYFEKFSQNNRKILSVEQWGNIAWTSFNKAFHSCQNMQVNAMDAPDLSSVTDLTDMFSGCSIMNADIGHWDVSTITNMQGVFLAARAFNQDLSSWDVSNVTNMFQTFGGATSFDQSLAAWDVTSVEQMSGFVNNTALSIANYDATLVSFSDQNVKSGVFMSSDRLFCVAGRNAREKLRQRGWSFNGDEFAFDCSPIMLSAIKDSDTQITVTFNEGVLTNGGNPTDFVVTDDANNTYVVSAQAAPSTGSTDIVLTVASLAGATGNLTITYANNNNELIEAATQTRIVDSGEVVIDFTPPLMVLGTRTSDTELIIRFDDDVQVVGTNAGDFVVKDQGNNAFSVTGIADGFAADEEITLTVADMSLSLGDLTITYTNNNNEVTNLNNVAMATDATGLVVADALAPVMLSAVKDSDTQITVTFSEPIRTNGGNPTDFTVTDGASNTYAVSAQADGTASDKELVLTVADLSAATGGLTITYINNNAEISDFADNELATDVAGVHISIFSDPSAFVTTWRTDEASEKVQIRTNDDNGENYDYTVDWGDGRIDSNRSGDATHTYANPGTYTVIITGDFPRLFLAALQDVPQRLMSVEQWGTGKWSSFKQAFQEAHNMQINATDIPDLTNVVDMSEAFSGAWSLNYDFAGWDVSEVKDMYRMFNNCYSLEGGLSTWNVGDVTDMQQMLNQTRVFKGDLSNWDVGNVTNMKQMFGSSTFNGDISGWDVSKVTDMSLMFIAADFDGDISNWNVGQVQDMRSMFAASSFSGDLSGWDVSSVTDMSSMFSLDEEFNSDLSGWDVSNVVSMNSMFADAESFNADISSWDVSNATEIYFMFENARSFNQDISGWDVSKVTRFERIFNGAGSFDQNLGNWDISGAFTMSAMLDNAGLSIDNYEATLIGWAAQEVPRGVSIGAQGLTYCNAGQAARDILTGGDNVWRISGDVRADLCPPVLVGADKVSDTEITAIFSDPVQTNGGNPTDFTVIDGAGNGITVTAQVDGTADDTEIDLTVADLSIALGDLTVTYTNNNNEISDASGTFIAESSGPVTIDLDAVAPVMQSGVIDNDTQITITFSEIIQTNETNPADFTVTDGNSTNYTVTVQADGTAFDNQVVLTVADISAAVGSLIVTYTNNNDEIMDFGGNVLETDANGIDVSSDATPPTVAITSSANDPTSGAFDITITFSEDVTGFDLADLTVGNGVAGNFAGSGDTYTALITPSADGVVTVDVAAAVAQDAAGNDNVAATQFSIENDETLPTVVISTMANDPINVAFDITLTFSEDVSGVASADLVITNGSASSLTGSGAVYMATITPAADGTLTVDLGAASAQDAAGNDNIAAAQFSIQADITAPAAPVITGISDDSGASATDNITNDNTQIFSGTAEANSTVEVFIDGSSIGTTTADGSGNWTFDHSGTALADGNYSVTATATDAATNTSALSAMFAVIIDLTAPNNPLLGSISDDNGISSTDFITSDMTLIYYGTAEPFATITIGSGPFTLLTTTADANGDWVGDATFRPFANPVNLFITATDRAGNTSANTNTFLIDIDSVVPIVQSIVRADPNPTTATSVDYTVTFDEEVHGLSTVNFGLVFTGTQNASIASISASSGTSFTVTVDNITGGGSFGLNLDDITGITDVAGNALSGTFTGEVYSTNFTPTDISLSASSILENNAIGDVVATMTTTDADAGDTHTYSLVTGVGDTDNASFTISGNELKAAEAFDLETKGSYDIRIQTDDGRGGTFEEAFTITIDNVAEADLRITGNNDIPATPLGITTNFDITIHNDGDAALTVGSILYPTAFGGPVSGITIAPNSSQVVTMDFTPTVAQLYTGDITIITNGGTGILSVSADGAIITSVDDGLLKAETIKLYPNPATDIVTIDLSKYNGRALDIQLYDMAGIKAFGISQYRESALKLDVSRYHNGLYLVQFTDGKSTVQKKVMIRK